MEYLRYQIAREIGVTQDWPVVIVGIGNLGHALANYSGFSSRGFRIVALLDADPERQGEDVGGLGIRPFDEIEALVEEHAVAIGVIATPAAGRPGRLRPARRGRASPASSTSPRPCSRCPTGSTSARSTCPSSCRSSPTTSSARSLADPAAGSLGTMADGTALDGAVGA